MDWHALLAGKALDWAWAIILGVVAYIWRIEAVMHKHASRVELLESEMRNRVSNAQSLQTAIDRVAHLVEQHRSESGERMSELRNELREDIKLLIGAIRKGPE
jgi:hypothetical protein